jgi:putative transposase
VACRLLGVSRSGYYEWRDRPASPRDQENELLLKHIKQIHRKSRETYGSPCVHAELTMGLGLPVNVKRVARLMRQAGVQGLYRRRRHGCTVRDPHAEPATDLVNRRFTVDAANRLWVTDITEHPTEEGKLYCAAVMDAYSRRIVGWSMAEHIRTELVTDALGMAIVRRQPADGQTILHSDHGTQYVVGLRATTPQRRPARLNGQRRGLLRQRHDGIVLGDPAT